MGIQVCDNSWFNFRNVCELVRIHILVIQALPSSRCFKPICGQLCRSGQRHTRRARRYRLRGSHGRRETVATRGDAPRGDDAATQDGRGARDGGAPASRGCRPSRRARRRRGDADGARRTGHRQRRRHRRHRRAWQAHHAGVRVQTRAAADVRDAREGSREGRDDTRARPHLSLIHI